MRERAALDKLLAIHPEFDLLHIDWQHAHWSRSTTGPWILVELGQRSDDGAEAWARHRYAIWKRTGDIYGVQLDGAVTDDPIIPGDS